MPRRTGINLTTNQKRILRKYMRKAKNVREYRAALGILLRAEGKTAEYVASKLEVTRKQVFKWCSKFKKEGIASLNIRKQTGRPAHAKDMAKETIPKLLQQDPQAFGFLKGKWVLRDISEQLKKEGIHLNYTGVRRALKDLGIGQKMPKLRAPGSIVKNYKKREEIRRYQKIAAALQKKM